MNHELLTNDVRPIAARELPDWMLSHGIGTITTEQASLLMDIPLNQVPQRMAALRKNRKIVSPSRGLWVAVAPEYRTWGAPDPMFYIDDMMIHLGVEYCIGWLTAAALHGASHQAPQVFQVATSKNTTDRTAGRSRLEFMTRGYVTEISKSMPSYLPARAEVATAGATALMLTSDPQRCGGMDNVATILVELTEENDGIERDIMKNAHLFSDASVRRIGWLLDEFGDGAPEEIRDLCGHLSSEPSFLSPTAPRTGDLDREWCLILNEEVEPDL